MSSASEGAPRTAAAISVKGLHFSFRSLRPAAEAEAGAGRVFARRRERVQALQNVSFRIAAGESVALLGANGAGKSTLVKVLAGVLHPTAGSVALSGLDPWRDKRRYRRQLGVVFGHRTQLWWDLPVADSLRFLGIVYQVDRSQGKHQLDVLTDVLDLGSLLRTPVRELSLGQRMRCEIAASLIHAPAVLLLDEPTIGLDIVSRVQLRQHLRILTAEKRCTVLLSSHDLLDVEGVTDRLLILESGALFYDDSLGRLWEALGPRTVSVSVLLDGRVPAALVEDLSEKNAAIRDGPDTANLGCNLSFQIDRENLVAALGLVLSRGDVLDIRIDQPSIEQIVVDLYREAAHP